MELQTVRIGRENIVPSGAKVDGISIHHSGIAKVLCRKVARDVPRSEVIKDSVNILLAISHKKRGRDCISYLL